MTKSDLENLAVGTRQDIWSRFGHFQHYAWKGYKNYTGLKYNFKETVTKIKPTKSLCLGPTLSEVNFEWEANFLVVVALFLIEEPAIDDYNYYYILLLHVM